VICYAATKVDLDVEIAQTRRRLRELRKRNRNAPMIHFISTDRYVTIAVFPDAPGLDLPEMCAALERLRDGGDGCAVLAQRDGRIVADADGYGDPDGLSSYERESGSPAGEPRSPRRGDES